MCVRAVICLNIQISIWNCARNCMSDEWAGDGCVEWRMANTQNIIIELLGIEGSIGRWNAQSSNYLFKWRSVGDEYTELFI